MHAAQRELQSTILADGLQVSGHGGCNRMSGLVEIRGDRASISRLAYACMACATPQQLESTHFDARERIGRWRINGHPLEWRDVRGHMLARLVASTPR